MSEHNDWRAVLLVLNVIFEPFELLRSKRAQPTGFEVHDIDQAHKMHALLVEAVPTLTLGVFAVSLAEHRSVIV